MESNKKRYDQARAAYEGFIGELIAGFQDRQIEDLSGVTAQRLRIPDLSGCPVFQR